MESHGLSFFLIYFLFYFIFNFFCHGLFATVPHLPFPSYKSFLLLLPLGWGGIACGWLWSETPNCKFVLRLNQHIFAGELSRSLFISGPQDQALSGQKVEAINLWSLTQYWARHKAHPGGRPGYFQLWGLLLPRQTVMRRQAGWQENGKSLLSSVHPQTIHMASALYPGYILEITRQLLKYTHAWAPSQRLWRNSIDLR